MPKQNKKGFTLIELLVVIAIIALLLAILMPGLKAAKRAGQGIVCTSNMRGIAVAAILYTDDNEGRFPDTDADDNDAWVRKPQYANGSTVPNNQMKDATFEDRQRGIMAGVLFPYTEAHKLYNCPGDRRISSAFRNYLSYSMPGGIPDKREQITSPDSKYIFLEESDPRPYFSGDWDIYWDEATPDDEGWRDGLAVWHNDSSTFAFADGHAEKHKWKDDLTRFRASWDLNELKMYGSGSGSYGPFLYGNWETSFKVTRRNSYNGQRNDLDWMIASHPGTGAKP